MIIRTIENRTFEVDDLPLVYGEPFVFADKDKPTEFWYGESWNYFPSEGGANAIELINPNMIRKHIVKEITIYSYGE